MVAEKYNKVSNGIIKNKEKIQWQSTLLRHEPREVNATKSVHEFRATSLECNAGQHENELLLHNHYIRRRVK